MDRVMIFIDGSNLFHACKAYDKNFKIDFLKLKEVLSEGRKLIRPYYYASFDPTSQSAEKQKNFYRFLQREGFRVVEKPLRLRNGFKIEKGVDVALVTDMLSLGYKDAYDVAILVSGDGDFVHCLDKIRDLGKQIEVAIFKNSISSELALNTDRLTYLDNLRDKIEKK